MSKSNKLQKISRFAISASLAAVAIPFSLLSSAAAQGSLRARPAVPQHIDENRLTTLGG